ncbi:uracil-DNA glycosylase, family 4 [Halopenitus malekzadehii]|uniref:Uracil-DNA glycosylase, family 4 n=1 Tax=Halopenitus malekzadehii TaxID=1267564 RepID=A0A1H6J4L1_9EURY|nr:uracil-DNA glycosylase family protein [Halopenitus malekzadehii]SEH56880.1 uracil-DNA glycosylase, family 4 [Halopenitus malekzadehii]
MNEDPDFPTRRHVLEPDCSRCDRLPADRTCISWGTGPLDAAVMVIGEAPAAGDPDAERWRGGNLTGKAYTASHSGRRIRRLFESIDYGGRTYYTNAVKCFPRDREADEPTHREPTAAELSTCRRHLRTELERVEPDVVCPTGKHATTSVLAIGAETDGADGEPAVELDGFLEAVLEPIDAGVGGPVVPLLHPAYQDVWRARLGYEAGEYRDAIAETLARVT